MHSFRDIARRRGHASLPGVPLKRNRRSAGRARLRLAGRLATVATLALAAGAALEYFFDRRSGKRRRSVVRARARGAVRRRARRIGRQAHYEAGKLTGLAYRVSRRSHGAAEVDDITLMRKVESELFRDRAIPKGRISINVDRGIVVLRGALDDTDQAARIERAARKVTGVRDVENLLHPTSTPAPAAHPHRDPRLTRPRR